MDLLIFDCDGVLVDSEIVSFEVEAAALTAAGIRVAPRDLLARFVGTSSSAMFATLSREHGVALPEGFAASVARRIHEAFETDLRPIAGIAELLAALPDRKCVASSSDPARIRQSLSLTAILHHFEPHIFSATQVRHGKPAPDLYLFAAERMGTPPSRCLAIEDSVAGVTAARAAGMTVLGFTGGSHCLAGHADKLRAAGAAEVFESMAAVGRRLALSPA